MALMICILLFLCTTVLVSFLLLRTSQVHMTMKKIPTTHVGNRQTTRSLGSVPLDTHDRPQARGTGRAAPRPAISAAKQEHLAHVTEQAIHSHTQASHDTNLRPRTHTPAHRIGRRTVPSPQARSQSVREAQQSRDLQHGTVCRFP